MNRIAALLGLIFILVAGLAVTGYVSAIPSAGLREANGDVFDDWGICRTRAFGEDGFYQISETTLRPVITFESLGEDVALAYRLGEQMAHQYPDRLQRAEAIFSFVRDRVQYTPDIDQFSYEEFAQNADELATVIDQNGVGYGDCEDSTVLLAVIYQGAGYRSAVVVGSGHTAALVYLPDYDKAAAVFELDGESGWVWAEATGRNNPLGWVPKELLNVELAAYEVKAEAIALVKPPDAPPTAIAQTGGGSSSLPFPFFGIMGLLWLLPLFRRRRAS
ncbi:transglutaminase domain-containing protein [Chloroflexota bacterium]